MVVIKSQPVKETPPKNSPVKIYVALGIIVVLAVAALAIRSFNQPKAAEPVITKSSKAETPQPSSSTKPSTPKEVAESKLAQEAKDTGKPYSIDSSELGAGYTFANIVYHKGDKNREYDEKKIVAPEVKVEEVDDEQSNNIRAQLLSKLPEINFGSKKTIVKDGSKVTLEVYKVEGENPYLVILNYEHQPFGYVRVNAAGEMTATVTSYAIDQVVEHNVGNGITGAADQIR